MAVRLGTCDLCPLDQYFAIKHVFFNEFEALRYKSRELYKILKNTAVIQCLQIKSLAPYRWL